jgi:putative Holliday junction resolvase
MRAMGVDFGEVRVGLSLSDETGTLASPLLTIRHRRGKRMPLGRIEETARRQGVEAVVVGLPLELSGEESEWCRQVRTLADELGARLNVPVHLVDERMSSVRAERSVRSIGLPRKRREEKGRVDAAAATIILQTWLDRGEWTQ